MLLLLIFLYAQYSSSKNYVIKDVEQDSFNRARFYSVKFEEKLAKSAIIPTMIAANPEFNTFTSEEKAKSYLTKILRQHPFVYSVGIAYEPDMLIPRRYFFPTCYMKNGKIHYSQAGTSEYDYTQETWYKEVKESGQSKWSSPHWDPNNLGMPLFSYSAPFYENGKFMGAATISISLEQIIGQINNIQLAHTGYVFLTGKNGEYLAFPDNSRILNGNIKDFDPKLGMMITSGSMGITTTREPFRNEKSLIVFHPAANSGLYLGFVYPEREVMWDIYVMEFKTILLALLGMSSLLAVIIIISNSVINPVSKLAEGVSHMAKGELNYKITVDATSSEVYELAKAFNLLSENIENQINEIRRMESEKERMESEIAIARRIQSSVIPVISPEDCRKHNVDIDGITLPAREVGGDFYDFFFIDDDHVGFMLGDASGKGIPAAIYMGVCRALLRSSAISGADPGACLTTANRHLCGENYSDMFITAFYGILNTKTGLLSFSNGGHMPPVIISRDKTEIMQDPDDIPLGIDKSVKYKTQIIEGLEGIVLYSDGVTDARNREGSFFSTERIQEAISGLRETNTANILNETCGILKKFTNGTEQGDDISLLIIKRK